MFFYISLIILPFVAALQRYAKAYGYDGLSKQEAFHSAKGAFIVMTIIEVIIISLIMIMR